jgi:DNA-3-methyladenine glycosylase II
MTETQLHHRSLLAATAPYSLACSLRAMGGFAPCGGDQVIDAGLVRKAFLRPGRPSEAVVAEVGPRADDSPGVELAIHAASPLTPDEVAGVELAVRRWLSLDDDLAPFLALARADPALAPVLAAATGLHQVRFASPAEGAAYFTLTQRSTQWFAAARKRRIAAEVGPRLEVGGVAYSAFPALSAVRALDDMELVGYAGGGQRAARLREVLDGLAALDEEWLYAAPYDEVRRALLAIRGVGEFTAHAILLRVLGRPDAVPLEMAQFARVVDALYPQPVPSAGELRQWYGPTIGWWAYLTRTALGWLDASPSSQRSRVRTPQPVAPLASSASAASDQAGADMSTCAQTPFDAPVNSRRNSAAITEPAPMSVALTRSATSLRSASA